MKKILLCLLLLLALTSLFACDALPEDTDHKSKYTNEDTDGYTDGYNGNQTEKPTESHTEKPTEPITEKPTDPVPDTHECQFALSESKASTCVEECY